MQRRVPVRRTKRIKKAKVGLNSTRIVVLSFGAMIAVGTLLLMLPIASADGVGQSFLTALFTATSANCVTGLVLMDTLTGWSFFGQAVILILIQLGGLGFMMVLTLFSMAANRRINLSRRLMIVSSLGLNDLGGVVQMVRFALKTTFLVEGACALILMVRFIPLYGPLNGIWRSLFISVSAMCNAGFDLMGPEKLGSLSLFDGDPIVLCTVMFLVVFGGLGFFVWDDLRRNRKWDALSLYSRLVLTVTGILILSGAVYFFCAEYSNPATFGPMPVWKKVLNSFFQSVTLRTAGFTAIDQGALHDSSVALCCVFMLIGGSSGSTAGGLKTATIATLLLSLRAGLRGRSQVTVRGRAIPTAQVLNALTLTLVVIILFFTCAMALSLIDDITFLQAAYECASALGTVGLSTGITGGLSPISHVLLICMMYLGRVGVISFSLAFLAGKREDSRIQYPTTNILIG